MREFTQEDATNLIEDLLLYSGNIQKITDLFGVNMHGDHFGGVIHTNMDSFNFSHNKVFTDDESWTIDLAAPVESILTGHRSLALLKFPKLHKSRELQARYRIANDLYDAYNNFSGLTEDSRIRDLEEALGYENLPSLGRVLAAIIDDFRSYDENRQKTTHDRRSLN